MIGVMGTIFSLIQAGQIDSSTNGSGVDVRDYIGLCKVIVDCSNVSGTSPTCTVKLQGSSDNSTWADISGATFTQATDEISVFESKDIVLDEQPRYIRAVATLGGTAPVFNLCVIGIARQ